MRPLGTASTLHHASENGERPLNTTRADLFSFLLNLPLALISSSALILLISHALSYYHGTSPDPSFRGDSDLSKLESDVIVSAVASNLLPDDKVPPREVEKVIEDFKEEGKDMRRWERVGRSVRVVGAVIFLGAQIAASRRLKEVAFPVRPIIVSRR